MAEKLIGHDYQTPDLVAKVTGKAKYAEDYRVEGMLFCKLLLSPYPHARVRRIDASRALAMAGVKGILTADALPAHADVLTDVRAPLAAHTRLLDSRPAHRGEHKGREGAVEGAGVSGRAGARDRRRRRAHGV